MFDVLERSELVGARLGGKLSYFSDCVLINIKCCIVRIRNEIYGCISFKYI